MAGAHLIVDAARALDLQRLPTEYVIGEIIAGAATDTVSLRHEPSNR